MMNCKKGDIVLVDFRFSEQSGSKKRPALVISSDRYHRNRQEVIVSAITTNIKRALIGDTKINQWKEAGLKHASSVAGIIQTIKIQMIMRKLGVLTLSDSKKVQENLGKILGFSK